ncbi:MAG TPA: type I methionyl aminopeptidase [Aggregatilineaceae bacterium]|nr:type I methionyl aminopeptidase [Aggregatilineaceae bacterium]
MTVDNDDDLQKLLRIGQICGQALQYMLGQVEPGMTTGALDALGAEFLKKHSARSAPILAYKFPGHTCISLNDEVAHGIPGERIIQPGDIINVDVSAELEGYWADTGASMVVPPVTEEYERLCQFTRRALDEAIKTVRANRLISQVGRVVENIAREGGYHIIPELGGHGVGRHIHEKPSVHNFYNKRDKERFTEGLVFTIEPFLTPGRGHIFTAKDGWTLKTVDHTIAAQYEHTLVVTKGDPILVTAA